MKKIVPAPYIDQTERWVNGCESISSVMLLQAVGIDIDPDTFIARDLPRAIDGDLAILAKHGDYCTALGMGEAHIVDAEGSRRRAACMGGMLTVLDGEVRLVATTWEWAEQIDHTRAEAAKKRAEEILARKDLDRREYEMAQARLKRALVRTSIKD